MPVYEYRCPKCKVKFELLRPMSRANDNASCPKCSNGAQRVLSTFAAFSRSSGGDSAPVSGGSGCAGCSSSNCSTCH